MTAGRPVDALFDPAVVAVVGASATPGKWGNVLARSLLRGEHRREVYLINRAGRSILGHRVYRSLSELPHAPELVVLVIPAVGFETAVDEALEAGALAIIGIVAGLGETSSSLRVREHAIANKVRRAGAVLLGPNCMGVIDNDAELYAAAHMTMPPGAIGLISQSGTIALDLALRARRLGTGFSRFVSLGNQADIGAVEIAATLVDHAATEVIALYLEGVRDGRDLPRLARTAAELGKPVVLLAPGRNEATSRAARSHTASLAASDTALDAVCKAGRILRVSTPRELFDVAVGALSRRYPKGRRLAVVSDGGGAGVVAASLGTAVGFNIVSFSDKLCGAIRATSSELATVGNPVDVLAGGALAMAGAVSVISDSSEVDAVLIVGTLGYFAAKDYPPDLGDLQDLGVEEVAAAHLIAETAVRTGMPVVATSISEARAVVGALTGARVPVCRELEGAIDLLQRLADYEAGPPWPVPGIPEASPPIGDTDYWAARGLFHGAGIPYLPARRATSLAGVLQAAREIGYPVALKALGLVHKSDVGGVVLSIDTDSALKVAYRELKDRLGSEAVTVEQMADLVGGVELIIGVRHDEMAGPVVAVGLGGIYVETLRDIAVALAPVDETTALRMFRQLRASPLLFGDRGRRALRVADAARVVVALSALASEHPEVAEFEINPLWVDARGVVAIDARVVLAPPSSEAA